MTSTRLDMTCRVCGEREVDLFLDLTDQPHCNRLISPKMAEHREPHFPLRVGFCRQCTLVQIDHTIPKESMFSNYPYVSGTTKTLVAHFKDSAARLVARYKLGSDDLVVDIGSNDGTWLKQYEPFGLRCQGVEPASNVVKLAHAAGVPTLNRFFDEETAEIILKDEGSSSLITAAGVFFHLEDLHSVVRGITRLLKRDGIFVVQAIYLGGMLENTAFDQVYHEHLCYYTLRSMEKLLSRHGLEIFDVGRLPIHGGSLEAHVGFPGMHPISDAVGRMREEEMIRGYGEFKTYQEFAKNVWTLKNELLGLLRRYKAEGKSVHAYGAPAKGATLLNSFGIGPDLVQLAAEKNPLKYGYLIPGVRIPIVEEGTVAAPDAYLVLAWNFITEFLNREQSYLENGGAFIVPVPELKTITKADLHF